MNRADHSTVRELLRQKEEAIVAQKDAAVAVEAAAKRSALAAQARAARSGTPVAAQMSASRTEPMLLPRPARS